MVEVILLPLNDDKADDNSKHVIVSPLKKFAGAWVGDQLVREDQVAYETREELK